MTYHDTVVFWRGIAAGVVAVAIIFVAVSEIAGVRWHPVKVGTPVEAECTLELHFELPSEQVKL